jgi:hypothetical protein
VDVSEATARFHRFDFLDFFLVAQTKYLGIFKIVAKKINHDPFAWI